MNRPPTPFYRSLVLLILAALTLLPACQTQGPTLAPEQSQQEEIILYLDPLQSVSSRVEDLLSRMTIEEKIGQMTQASKDALRPGDVETYLLGSVLSGGGGSPPENTLESWIAMVDGFQQEALSTRLAIPLLYGVDAVHGHGNLHGATIFPHQIGLGATRNPELVSQIGTATALEMRATGIPWNFAPVLAAPLDIRWGRTYEAFGEDPELVSSLAAAYQRGLQSIPADYPAAPGQSIFVLATPKHYLGDGGTVWGSSTSDGYLLDQGDMLLSEDQVRDLFLPPYADAVQGGALSIMPSYSSWQGQKMHASSYWLSDVLKGELGFPGFLISDWNAINQLDENYYQAVVSGINAGLDMAMISSDFKGFISVMKQALENGDISESRIDDAVRRILTAKFSLGLFERPYAVEDYQDLVGSAEHRDLARQAVRESLVLLKNEREVLPLSRDLPLIYVAGLGADNIGLQCGGWTINWQGGFGAIQPGTSILAGIQELAGAESQVVYHSGGDFDQIADAAIVVVGETPYAEGRGDRQNLTLSQKDINLIETMRTKSEILIVVILSGRPLVISEQYPLADAWIAAWLPGTEGQGIAEVIFGDFPFTGKLPFSWPRSNEQLPINIHQSQNLTGCDAPLFPYDFGLGAAGSQDIEWIDCE